MMSIIRTIVNYASGFASGWRIWLLMAALIALLTTAAFWRGHSSGYDQAKAICEASAARAETMRRQAEISAQKDADLLAAEIATQANRERGQSEIIDRLGKGTF